MKETEIGNEIARIIDAALETEDEITLDRVAVEVPQRHQRHRQVILRWRYPQAARRSISTRGVGSGVAGVFCRKLPIHRCFAGVARCKWRKTPTGGVTR